MNLKSKTDAGHTATSLKNLIFCLQHTVDSTLTASTFQAYLGETPDALMQVV